MSLTKQDLSVIGKILNKRINPLRKAQKKLEKWRKEIKDDPNILERGREKLELLRKEYKNDVELIKRGQRKLEQWKLELENIKLGSLIFGVAFFLFFNSVFMINIVLSQNS